MDDEYHCSVQYQGDIIFFWKAKEIVINYKDMILKTDNKIYYIVSCYERKQNNVGIRLINSINSNFIDVRFKFKDEDDAVKIENRINLEKTKMKYLYCKFNAEVPTILFNDDLKNLHKLAGLILIRWDFRNNNNEFIIFTGNYKNTTLKFDCKNNEIILYSSECSIYIKTFGILEHAAFRFHKELFNVNNISNK